MDPATSAALSRLLQQVATMRAQGADDAEVRAFLLAEKAKAERLLAEIEATTPSDPAAR